MWDIFIDGNKIYFNFFHLQFMFKKDRVKNYNEITVNV